MSYFQRPPALSQGSLVYVVAPSSPFDHERFARGLARLQTRYRVRLADGLFEQVGYLAGNDRTRTAALHFALNDPEVAAIVAARGGYGATRLLANFTVTQVQRANKWLVGFSDITALHALWARAGRCSLHGAMVASLCDAPPATQANWFCALEGQLPPPLDNLTCVRAGQARGVLLGGNLAVLTALVGTPYFPKLAEAVLLLEDIGERPYRIDRMLTTLMQAGALAEVRAVVLGQFTQCDPGRDGVDALHVLSERLAELDVPIASGAPIGHIADNHVALLGAEVEVDTQRGFLRYLSPGLPG